MASLKNEKSLATNLPWHLVSRCDPIQESSTIPTEDIYTPESTNMEPNR